MKTSDFAEFIARLTPEFTAVINVGFKREDYIAIDLSENNPDLSGVDISSSEAFTDFVTNFLRSSGKKVAFGGYNEVRKLYERSELFTTNEDAGSNRNIHLGMDFWAAEKTPVLAVLEGKVHSFKDNVNFGDYGPTIILQHFYAGRTFYTLYGHLSRRSLQNIKEGDEVKRGQKIGELGAASENGDYAPHLHFQIIERLREKVGDFPGVTSRSELDFYLQNCPNPNLLLKIQET